MSSSLAFQYQLTDPDRTEVELGAQLATLGLALQNTIGDGNCLFRALSDQLYGTEGYHLPLRAEVTNWMAAHPDRYAGFVEDDRGFDEHLICMRQPGTYGGHLELSAFAHLKRKNVKVIQPGLVYVIEWNTGAPLSPVDRAFTGSEQELHPPPSPSLEREHRRVRREKLREGKEKDIDSHPSLGDTVYVAYHDWEHFSSVRTVSGQLPLQAMAPTTTIPAGPDAGPLPQPSVAPATATISLETPPLRARQLRGRPRKQPQSALTPIPATLDTAVPPSTIITAPTPTAPSTVPLPRSLTPSTNSSADDANSASSTTLSQSTATSSIAPLTPSDSASALHVHLHDSNAKGRSPKRSLESMDEAPSDGSDPRGAKRRAGGLSGLRSTLNAPRGGDSVVTPPLSSSTTTPGSSHPPPSRGSSIGAEMEEDEESSELSSLEDVEEMLQGGERESSTISPGSKPPSTSLSSPSTPSKLPTKKVAGRRVKKGKVDLLSGDVDPAKLTRRQRKQFGLPKPRLKRVILTVNGKRPSEAGPKPGESNGAGAIGEVQAEAEHGWMKNGAGRLDVRGFRELKI
ncbi:uncharacterized protein EI90DRAFT_3136826 [Cantharellus anzutake]|uniref:uncharacterized protein n=1 Tax=Cantharellus anzutake TaxID=1750568 RepID=UPI001903C912|nr:uncharacterized protein EI90DRAFT_3136826 [Cantharellus anzutake]KAF8313311.1 hypothetical protein EI90DRAFT_3136826 [Cantharellus anzutake]